MRGGISGVGGEKKKRERRPNWFCIKMSLPGGLPPKSGHSMSSNLKSLGCLLLIGQRPGKKRERGTERKREKEEDGGAVGWLGRWH